jgi:hypothetical protein
MRTGRLRLLLLLAMPLALTAQQPSQPVAQPAATGTVIGHVYLGDTHLPARMATVALLFIAGGEAKDAKPADSNATAQTGLDGSFLISNVAPGEYYVVAKKFGYLPVADASDDDFEHPSKDLEHALAAALTPVKVAANRTSMTDVTLARGAAISGTVRFDDGEPYAPVLILLLRKDESGKWLSYDPAETGGLFEGVPTDDQGHFRMAGLPAGEYLLKTSLETGGYSLDVYSGDGIRLRDAKAIKVKDGEDSTGDNIEIPLAKLHSVSGTVTSLETGLAVNSARVELRDPDDDSVVAATATGGSGSEFHFLYVPEGEYVLKVKNASDVTGGGTICPGCVPRPEGEKVVRSYEDGSQPIVVHEDMSSVTIPVRPEPTVTGASAQ